MLFPKTGFSTEDLVEVYERLAPALLPHLAHRPVTLKRFPDDIHGEAFWEKDAPSFTPARVKRLPVPRKHENSVIQYMSFPDRKSLRWAASLGCIELHPFLHRYPYIESPTLIAFDLDPGEGMDILDCCAVALDIQRWFAQHGLECFPKVSGSKGLQLYIPLNTPSSYAITQPLARHVAEELEGSHPGKIISSMVRADRRDKVFIDWSQNAEHKTTVSVYSVRAKHEQPYVSVPISWKELRNALTKRKRELLIFTPEAAIERVDNGGDIFSPVLTLEQRLPAKLVRDLRLPASPLPRPVRLPAVRENPTALPRSSGQGGRKLFVVHKRANAFELGVERNDRFDLFEFKRLPAAKQRVVLSPVKGTEPLNYLTDESKHAGIVWDLGTYELVEGSYAKGHMLVFLSGRRLGGEWGLTRHAEDWELRNEGGRIKQSKSELSALTHPPIARAS